MVKVNSEWGFGAMKKFLIAAGVGALLVVAQTAVSAVYNPLDRVGDAAVAPVAPAAQSMSRPAMAFDAPYAPVDLAVGDSTFGSEEITAPSPRREIPVTDRVSGSTGRYNLALDAVTEEETCVKGGDTVKFAKATPVNGKWAGKCQAEDSPISATNWNPGYLIPGLGALAVAATVASDSGETD